MSEPGRSGQIALFKSDAGMNCIKETNVIYRELYGRYNQKIPCEVKQDFYAMIDRALVQDINRGLLDEIQAFFLDCLGI